MSVKRDTWGKVMRASQGMSRAHRKLAFEAEVWRTSGAQYDAKVCVRAKRDRFGQAIGRPGRGRCSNIVGDYTPTGAVKKALVDLAKRLK